MLVVFHDVFLEVEFFLNSSSHGLEIYVDTKFLFFQAQVENIILNVSS